MQLQKLKKRAFRINKSYQMQRLRYYSLNIIIPPTPLLTNQQITKQMINSDACLHDNNNQQLILQQFSQQLPNTKKVDINKMYMLFITQIKINDCNQKQSNMDKDRDNKYQNKGDRKQKHTNNDMAAENNKKYIQKCTNCMIKIYDQADKKHEIKKYKISKLDKQIQKLYYDCHQYFVELMQLRKQTEPQLSIIQQKQKQLQNEQSSIKKIQSKENGQEQQIHIDIQSHQNTRRSIRRNSLMRIPSIQQMTLNKNIQKVKQIITEKQEQLRKLTDAERNLRQQKTQFLKLLLRNGYRQVDGIKWILIKLARNDENLSQGDFYHILDNTTKECLIKEYQSIRAQLKKQNLSKLPSLRHSVNPKAQTTQLQPNPSMPILSYARLMDIPNTDKSCRIYKNAQDYIVDWVRKQKWKVRSLSLKSKSTLPSERSKDWKDDEVKRLKQTYPKQQYQNIMKYMFGNTKYYTIKQSLALGHQKMRGATRNISIQQNGLKSSQAGAQQQHLPKYLTRNNTDKSQQNIRISYAPKRKQSDKARRKHRLQSI